MRKPFKIALPALGASALLIAGASAALATTISSGGAPYNGDVKVTNITPTKFSGNGPGIGLITSTCNAVSLVASVVSDGSGGQLKSASLTSCTNNYGGSDTYTVNNLPYSGASAHYDAAHTNNRDGYLTINAPNSSVDVRAVLHLTNLGRTETCHYGLTTTTPLTIDLFNSTNPNRPDTGNPHSQGQLTGQQLQKISNPENTAGCPAAVSGNGKFQVLTEPGGADLTIAP
ncbi:hypothetical protein [Actinomadura sp. NPDC048394]|uniref:hypothetical protein n=1 Tax=Actinomadura sp. NPDC048394 TaxID=3158223 RepID=UPI0033D876BD